MSLVNDALTEQGPAVLPALVLLARECVSLSIVVLLGPVQVVNKGGYAEGHQEGHQGNRQAGPHRNQDHLVAEEVPAEHDTGNPAECEADSNDMFDELKVNDESVDHVAGIFSGNSFQLEPPVQAGSKKPAGDPHAEKEDAGIDSVACQQAGMKVYLLDANRKEKRGDQPGEIYRTGVFDDGYSYLLEHVRPPWLMGVFRVMLLQ